MLSAILGGLGNDLVAFGIMRKVDAGARTFLSSGLGMLAVWSSGPGDVNEWRDSMSQLVVLISARKPAPGTCSFSRPSASYERSVARLGVEKVSVHRMLRTRIASSILEMPLL